MLRLLKQERAARNEVSCQSRQIVGKIVVAEARARICARSLMKQQEGKVEIMESSMYNLKGEEASLYILVR